MFAEENQRLTGGIRQVLLFGNSVMFGPFDGKSIRPVAHGAFPTFDFFADRLPGDAAGPKPSRSSDERTEVARSTAHGGHREMSEGGVSPNDRRTRPCRDLPEQN